MPRPGTGVVDLSLWWVHTVSVERFTGSGAYGDLYDAAMDVTGAIDDEQRLVMNAEGQQIIAAAVVWLPIDTAIIPIRSRVTLPVSFGGRRYEVVSSARRESTPLPLPAFWELVLR